MKKLLVAIAAFTLSTTLAFAGPWDEGDAYDTVLPNSSDTYYIDVIGDEYLTGIFLAGDCFRSRQDIDLWVYDEYDNLIAKETDNGCHHEIYIEHRYNYDGYIKVVVENQNKPFATDYYIEFLNVE